MIDDRAEHRVSACPVHFIWDGRGMGRMAVRWGFFGLIAALALSTASRWLHVEVLSTGALIVGAPALAAYLAGQAVSAVVSLRGRSQAR